MSRNVVICCDGTSNQFGPTTTNVGRLVSILASDAKTQSIHYAPGVGTLPEPGFATHMGQQLSLIQGLALGTGLTRIVEEAYSYLMDFWRPGDQVYLFGFSRGAYTARVLAAMLHALGLLPRGSQNLVPYAMRLFQAVRSSKPSEHVLENAGSGSGHFDRKSGSKRQLMYWDLLDNFRDTFSRTIPLADNPQNRRFPVHFLGVWDTVSSVGWAWEPMTFPYSSNNPGIATVRHALAIDERRWFFRQNSFHPPLQQDCDERWFAGAHCDVGGGYGENEGQLWRISFSWMLRSAIAKGLIVDTVRLHEMEASAPPTPWNEQQHESLTAKWWPAEFVPKWRWQSSKNRKILSFGMGRHRYIPKGARIDRSVLLRIRETDYRPPNLPVTFIERVRSLKEVPSELALES